MTICSKAAGHQGDGFILGTFTLQGVGLGTTALTFDWTSLSDGNAQSLSFDTVGGSLTVRASEPQGTLLCGTLPKSPALA